MLLSHREKYSTEPFDVPLMDVILIWMDIQGYTNKCRYKSDRLISIHFYHIVTSGMYSVTVFYIQLTALKCKVTA